jgi:hypothetical protein
MARIMPGPKLCAAPHACCFCLLLAWPPTVCAQFTPDPQCSPVIAPPDTFFQHVGEHDREIARQFYKKYLDIKGMPVVASGQVADLALRRTYAAPDLSLCHLYESL